jgi:Nucleotidyl transferase AbiEii toxin, Type IV TA system
MSSADFAALVERAVQAGNRSHMRPVVEKELLHYDILFALDTEGLLDLLTFQGDTSLRLCYGSPRFSEDLDFVGGEAFSTSTMLRMKSCIERYVGERYRLHVSVKEPRELAHEAENRHVKVHKWQIRVTTAPARHDLPTQMIKIEIAAIPAYRRVPAARLIERLPGIVHGKEFRDQMSRFIPLDVQERTFLKEKFLVLLEKETLRNLTDAVKAAER